MKPLRREDLYDLQAYAVERLAFRARVLAHKRLRRLTLGAHASLLFEDRLTVQYQVQEMLRIEGITDAAGIQDELDAYAAQVPGGRDLRATLLLEYTDAEARATALARLGGIARAVRSEIAGLGHAGTFTDDAENPAADDTTTATKAAAVHALRFASDPAQIAALRSGAGLAVVCDDPRMPVRVDVPAGMRAALLHDFD